MISVTRPHVVVRALCAGAMLAAMLGASPAGATDPAPNKCGGTSALGSPRSCTFYFKGSPFRFNASSSAAGTGRVWVTLDGYPETYGLPGVIGCQAEAGRTSCGGGYPDETTVLDLPHQASSVFFKLRCHFAGSGATWAYGCQAGS